MKPLAVGMIVAAISLHLAAYEISYWLPFDFSEKTREGLGIGQGIILGWTIPALLIGTAMQLWLRKPG